MMQNNFIGRKLHVPLIQNLKIEAGCSNAKRTTGRHSDPWNSFHVPLVKPVNNDSGDAAKDYAKKELHNLLFVSANYKTANKSLSLLGVLSFIFRRLHVPDGFPQQ